MPGLIEALVPKFLIFWPLVNQNSTYLLSSFYIGLWKMTLPSYDSSNTLKSALVEIYPFHSRMALQRIWSATLPKVKYPFFFKRIIVNLNKISLKFILIHKESNSYEIKQAPNYYFIFPLQRESLLPLLAYSYGIHSISLNNILLDFSPSFRHDIDSLLWDLFLSPLSPYPHYAWAIPQLSQYNYM